MALSSSRVWGHPSLGDPKWCILNDTCAVPDPERCVPISPDLLCLMGGTLKELSHWDWHQIQVAFRPLLPCSTSSSLCIVHLIFGSKNQGVSVVTVLTSPSLLGLRPATPPHPRTRSLPCVSPITQSGHTGAWVSLLRGHHFCAHRWDWAKALLWFVKLIQNRKQAFDVPFQLHVGRPKCFIPRHWVYCYCINAAANFIQEHHHPFMGLSNSISDGFEHHLRSTRRASLYWALETSQSSCLGCEA